jgi:hypothetical protein
MAFIPAHLRGAFTKKQLRALRDESVSVDNLRNTSSRGGGMSGGGAGVNLNQGAGNVAQVALNGVPVPDFQVNNPRPQRRGRRIGG